MAQMAALRFLYLNFAPLLFPARTSRRRVRSAAISPSCADEVRRLIDAAPALRLDVPEDMRFVGWSANALEDASGRVARAWVRIGGILSYD